MAKTLTLDEMLDCIELLGDRELAATFARRMEAIGDEMRDYLSSRLQVRSTPARREESVFAGTCATFGPAEPGQPCPYPLTHYDVTEWDDAS